jgi:hypothetical protein
MPFAAGRGDLRLAKWPCVEEVFQNATDADISRSSGRPVVFGDTSAGRHVMVVYEEIDADTVYPVTAFDVPRRQRP